VRDDDGEDGGEENQPQPQPQTPHLQLEALVKAGGKHRDGLALEQRRLDEVHGCEVGQRVGEQSLGYEDEVDDYLEGLGGQVVGDNFFCGHAPGQEPDVGEYNFEDGGGDVSPVHHAAELGLVGEVALQRREEDLGGVAEDDHAQRDGEGPDVDPDLDLVPAPLLTLVRQ